MGLDSKRLIERNGGEGEKEETGSRELLDWGCTSESSKERGKERELDPWCLKLPKKVSARPLGNLGAQSLIRRLLSLRGLSLP